MNKIVAFASAAVLGLTVSACGGADETAVEDDAMMTDDTMGADTMAADPMMTDDTMVPETDPLMEQELMDENGEMIDGTMPGEGSTGVEETVDPAQPM